MTTIAQLSYVAGTAAENMAVDAYLLAAAADHDCIVWRTYGWKEAAISFGYSQRFAWVRSAIQPFDGSTVRRLTGGGIVDHRNDLTYALIIPATHPLHREKATTLYHDLHAGISGILNRSGMRTSLLPCNRPCHTGESPEFPGVCFQSPEPFDIILEASGQKVAGAAMKRTRDALLIQGSLARSSLIPGEPAFADAFSAFLKCWLKADDTVRRPYPSARLIAPYALPYLSAEWNQRR